MRNRYNKCSVFVLVSAGSPVHPAFITDLSEALQQIRNRELEQLVVIHPERDENAQGAFHRISESIPTQCIALSPTKSLIEWVNIGLTKALPQGNDVVLIAGNITLAPNTLSTLCSTSAQAENFAPLSARLFGEPNPVKVTPDNQEQAFTSFLSQCEFVDTTRPVQSPSALCVLIPSRLILEIGTLSQSERTLGDAIEELSRRAMASNFLPVEVNKAFHCISPQVSAHEYLVTRVQTPLGVIDNEQDTESASSRDTVCPSELRERLFRMRAAPSSARPSLVIDLSKLPENFNPIFEIGCSLAASMHSRRAWDTTVVSSTPRASQRWALKARFPNASIIHSTPRRCFDYALATTFPSDLDSLRNFIELSPRPFAIGCDLFARHHFASTQDLEAARGLYTISLNAIAGLILVGEHAVSSMRANIPHLSSKPLCPILPSMLAKEYSRSTDGFSGGTTRNTILFVAPEQCSSYIRTTFTLLRDELPKFPVVCVGDSFSEDSDVTALQWSGVTPEAWCELIDAALLVVLPVLEDQFSLELARILAHRKVVVTLRNQLASEIKHFWDGPRGLILCDTPSEIVACASQLADPSRRNRLAVDGTETVVESNPWRWSQIGNSLNEFLKKAAPLAANFGDDLVRNWSFISSSIDTIHPWYESRINEAETKLASAQQSIKELERKLRALESSQTVLVNDATPSTKRAFQQALHALQDWANKPK